MAPLLGGAKAAPAPPPGPPMPSGFNVSDPNLDSRANNKAYSNDVSSVGPALMLNAIIGAACLTGFLVFRMLQPHYQLRQHVPYVTVKPPTVAKSAGLLSRMFGWVMPVLTTSDVWLLHAAGLDALVLQKCLTMCVQIFLPVVVLGCCLLMPLQLNEAFERGDSSFSRLTMANVRPGSSIMWAHWLCTFAFLAWTLTVLEYHFREYVALRQYYLRAVTGPNQWRALHMSEADGLAASGGGREAGVRFSDLVDAARAKDLLKAMAGEAPPPPSNWLLKTLEKITSWTGGAGPEAVEAFDHELTASDADDAAVRRLRRVATRVASKTQPRPSGRAQPQQRALGEAAERALAAPPAERATAGAGAGDDGDDDGAALRDPVAPPWWTSVGVVAGEHGKLRPLTPEEAEATKGSHAMLARPSVRYRKTVNTFSSGGLPVAVNAQQYAVLVTDVDQPVYPEFAGAAVASEEGSGAAAVGSVLGSGVCGKPIVKHSDEPLWLGARYAKFADDLAAATLASKTKLEEGAPAAGTAGQPAGKDVELAPANGGKDAADAAAALDAAEAGAPRKGTTAVARTTKPSSGAAARSPAVAARAAELWGVARAAMRDGRLRKLQRSARHSLVSAVFASLFPLDFDRVVPVFNFREVDLLMRQWDARSARLENAENAVANGAKPRTVKPKGAAAPVDEVAWLRLEVKRLAAAVREARERALALNGTTSYFVLFRTQRSAAIAASCNIHPLRRQLFSVHPAPGPEEVNWQALWYTNRQRVVRGLIVVPCIVALVMVPVSLLTSALTQLNEAFCSPSNTVLRWDDYCRGGKVYGILKGLLTGFVPALLIMLWQALAMPRLVFLAAQSEARHFSLSQLDLRMGAVYFLWSALNFFVGGVVGSTVLAQVPELVSKPFETPQRLGYALPASAKFFLTYLILRTFMTVPLRFLIAQPGVWQAWIRFGISLFNKNIKDDKATSRALYMRTAIRSPRYGVEFGGNICLILLVSFAYATICPLVPLLALGFFAGSWFFWRYQLIYNYQRKYESGGAFFPFVATRVLVCAGVMVAFTGCVLIVKSAWAQAVLLWVVGFVAVIAYSSRVNALYLASMREMPLLVAMAAPRARVPSTVYVPPPLQAGGLLWWPEHNKVWQHLGMPGYSW